MDAAAILDTVSAPELARLAGVERSTAHRWKTRKSKIPAAVVRLVALRVLGDVAALLGQDWRGWRFGRDGLLYAPGWRRGFTPGEIAAQPFLYGERATLRRELEQLRAEVEQLVAELETEKKKTAFYRRQVQLESRLGLALARIAG